MGIEGAKQLNPFAVRFRYEKEATEPDPTFDRVEVIRVATLALAWAAGIVESD